MSEINFKDRIKTATKLNIDSLIVKLEESLPNEIETKDIKKIVDGRVFIIDSVREMLIDLISSKQQSDLDYIKLTVSTLKSGSENTFEVLESLSKADIEEEDQTKYATIAKAKLEAHRNLRVIYDSILELDKQLESEDIQLRQTTMTSGIEKYAISKRNN